MVQVKETLSNALQVALAAWPSHCSPFVTIGMMVAWGDLENSLFDLFACGSSCGNLSSAENDRSTSTILPALAVLLSSAQASRMRGESCSGHQP